MRDNTVFHSVIADGMNERLNDSVRHRNGVSKNLFLCLVLRVLLDRGRRAIKYGGAELCTSCWKSMSLCIFRRVLSGVHPVSLYKSVFDVYRLAPVTIGAARI